MDYDHGKFASLKYSSLLEQPSKKPICFAINHPSESMEYFRWHCKSEIEDFMLNLNSNTSSKSMLGAHYNSNKVYPLKIWATLLETQKSQKNMWAL